MQPSMKLYFMVLRLPRHSAFTDSKFSGTLLVINQANKESSCLDDKMLLYCQELHKLENNFDGLDYLHIL
jgi:hypothetical protein